MDITSGINCTERGFLSVTALLSTWLCIRQLFFRDLYGQMEAYRISNMVHNIIYSSYIQYLIYNFHYSLISSQLPSLPRATLISLTILGHDMRSKLSTSTPHVALFTFNIIRVGIRE